MKKLTHIIVLIALSIGIGYGQAKISINNSYVREYGGTNPALGGKPIYIVLVNGNPNAITPGNGWLISESEYDMLRWVISTNTGIYIVPFGYNTNHALPLTLTIGTAGTGTGWIDFSTWHTVADNWTGIPSVTGPPSDVKNMASATSGGAPSNSDNSYNVVDRFWVMDASSYTTKPSLSGVKFSYISNTGTPSEVSTPNVFNESNLTAQRFNPATGMGWDDWLGLASTDVIVGAIGTVSSGTVSSANFFRSWTLTNLLDPLPISISSLTSQCDNGAALIQWTSQSEVDNDYYTIKKTTDDIHFETVGIIKAQGTGNSSQPENYSIVDNSPFGGQSYYFLYQTDLDGTITAANIPFTTFTGCGNDEVASTVNAYNTINYIEIHINSVDVDNYDISLVNMLGQTIFTENHTVALGDNEIRLNNNVSPGIYILNVRNGKVNYAKKMVIGVR